MLDTNIFISGIHWNGSCTRILEAWFRGAFTLVLSFPILAELRYALRAFRVPLNAPALQWWEQLLLTKSLIVTQVPKLPPLRADPSDTKFLEAALAARAQFLISQDRHLLDLRTYRGIRILNPKQFLQLLR